jgi:hypothetical protein
MEANRFEKGMTVNWISPIAKQKYICAIKEVKRRDKTLKIVPKFNHSENERTMPFDYFWVDFDEVQIAN